VGLYSHIEGLWWTDHKPPLALRLLEPVYSLISDKHLQQRAEQNIQPPLPVISVGNITAGGSGKTPFVLWLAKALQEKGFKPVIICRGDGGNNKLPRYVEKELSAIEIGDEARMLADLSGLPVILAADRIAACNLATEQGNIIILDDGFQYRHLQRICDIVLIPTEGVGNGHRIPAGPLREPLSSLKRADIIVRTGEKDAMALYQPLTSDREWSWLSQSDGLVDVMGGHTVAPENVYAATSIARPERFFKSLLKSGLSISGKCSFPDHHQFTDREVELLQAEEHVAITAKDAVKLIPLWPKERPLWLLKLKGFGEPGLIEAISEYIPET